MATEEGIVIAASCGTATVKTTKSSACAGCASKDSCNTMGSGEMTVDALNEPGAVAGDRIVLSFDTASLLKATFLLYVFPILAMIVGAVIGQEIALSVDVDVSAGSVVMGFLFFILAIFFVKARGNRLAEKDAYKPKIIRILRQNSEVNPIHLETGP